jgi:hypothetical protein
MSKEAESISKIRDILFGNNLTELEKRFTKTESFLREEISSLDEKLVQRLDEFKTATRSTLDEHDDRLRIQKSELQTGIERLQDEMAQLQNLVKQQDEKLNSELQSMKNWLTEQNDNLVRQQKRQFTELKTQMFSLIDDLRQSKLDRSALAVLLSEIAVHLVDEENPVEPDEAPENQAYD